LGAGLIKSLKKKYPGVAFVGLGGREMNAEGLRSLGSIEKLSINGIFEPLLRLVEFVRLLFRFEKYLMKYRPKVFIGIDYNGFNLILERRLKKKGIKVVHYVSPSVYAWRKGRVNTVAKSADLLLSLFPFERSLYDRADIEVVHVGHPVADAIPFSSELLSRRRNQASKFDITHDGRRVVIMPGSRLSEFRRLAKIFLLAARRVSAVYDSVFIIPCVNHEIQDAAIKLIEEFGDLDIKLYLGDARPALLAGDVALVKSGTGTMEAMLCRCPMVVAYRLDPITYRLVKSMVKIPFIALPNILYGGRLVDEYIQNDVTPEALGDKLISLLDWRYDHSYYLNVAGNIHAQLACDADRRAAEAIFGLLEEN